MLLSVTNLYATYIVVGGATQGFAALSDRRNKAMGFALAFVLGSFLTNFLAQFWDPAERIVFASFPHYYRPAQVLLRDALPVGDITVLLIGGAALWGVACVIWTRRSVRTI